MGSIPLPALQVRPPEQQEDPLSKYVKLKSLLQGQQLQQQQLQEGQLDIQQKQAQMRDMQTVQQLMPKYVTKDQSGKPTGYDWNGLTTAAAQAGLQPQTLEKLQTAQKAGFDTVLAKTNADKASIALENELNSQAYQKLESVRSLPQEQRIPVYMQALQWYQSKGGQIDPKTAPPPTDQNLSMIEAALGQHAQALSDAEKQADLAAKQSGKQKTDIEIQNMQQFGSATPTEQQRFASDYLKSQGLPNTPENRQKAFDVYTQKTKIAPAQVRVEGFGNIRGMNVTDTKTGVTMPMSWNDYNKLSKAEPGRYTSPQYDPETQMAVKAWRDLAPSGAVGKQVTSYDTFLRHTGDLYDAVSSLQNTQFPFMNKGINELRNMTGDPRVKTFLAKLDPVKKEFESFLLNNRALYEDDRKDAAKIIDESASPAMMLSVLPSLAHTAQARMGATNETFKRATGEDIPNLVSPEAQAAIQKVGGGQQAKAGYKMGDIKNYQGHDYVFDGKQWVLKSQ